MRELTVSSKGQILLPADLRRRLGLGAGAKLELLESPDGLTLRLPRPAQRSEVAHLAGMVKAPSHGKPRSLDDFDPAAALAGGRRR